MNGDSNRLSSRTVVVVVIALVAIACSVDTRGLGDAMIEAGILLRDATRSDAAAQDAPCVQWEVTTWEAPDNCSGAGVNATESCMVPASWEPFHSTYGDLSGTTALRRCTAR